MRQVHALRDGRDTKETETGNSSTANADDAHARASAAPELVATLRLSVPSYLYAVSFVTPPTAVAKSSATCPSIVTGGADGALRLWDLHGYVGELSGKYGHNHRINAVVQDPRSGAVIRWAHSSRSSWLPCA